MRHRTALAAAGVALFAFLLYHSTLLPGFDFGDTPSFQVMGGEAAITPRDGYPLYFGIGSAFVWLAGDRAHGLNLASAVEAAVASGLLVLVATELAGAFLPGLAAALIFAGSYTFWSQSIITEVYALHICMVVLTMWLLLRWERSPTLAHLAWFFAMYALGFGDHLMMVLLLPAYTLFLLASAPGGWRTMCTPRVVGLACALAAIGALQYAWNIRSLWFEVTPPRTFLEAMRIFWFDVTKSDWRDTMMASIPRGMYSERLRMYAFDVRQQFTWAGPVVAAFGLVYLFRTAPRRAWLLLVAFVVNVLFALSYNVGDSHVFFLPSHLMLVLLIAPGLAWLDGMFDIAGRRLAVVSAVAVLAAAAGIYENYPALDRSADTRPTDLINALTAGLDDRHAILLTDLNWQVQNGLTYFVKAVRPDVATARMPDVLLYAPALVRDNLAIGRDVALTEQARHELAAAYGPLFTVVRDPRVSVPSFARLTARLPRGTRYVVSILTPSHEFSIDRDDLEAGLRQLTGGAAAPLAHEDYVAVAGEVGAPPALQMSSSRPFRASAKLDGINVDIRMESWLAFDTIRRMGFGQVIAARQHTLIIERGLSFAAFDERGHPLLLGYGANIFAPKARYLVQEMTLR